MYVDTRPRGARVMIDGRDQGSTPLTVKTLSAGSHTVRIDLSGYKPVTTTVEIKPGIELPLTVTLELVGGPRRF